MVLVDGLGLREPEDVVGNSIVCAHVTVEKVSLHPGITTNIKFIKVD